MNITLINQAQRYYISQKEADLLCSYILRSEAKNPGPPVKAFFTKVKPAKCELSLTLCDDPYIQKINNAYLNRNRPTDVISFSQIEGEHADLNPETLGDIIISVDTARRQASEYGHSIKKELILLITHGVLHVLGYEHEMDHPYKKEMLERQERYSKMFYERLMKGVKK